MACKLLKLSLHLMQRSTQSINIDDQTPLDLVPRHSDFEELLVLLGAMRCQEKYSSRVEGDGGTSMGFLDEDDYS